MIRSLISASALPLCDEASNGLIPGGGLSLPGDLDDVIAELGGHDI